MSLLRNRLYYQLKPFIPRTVRRAVRRQLASRLRRSIADIWPIMPGSEQPPQNWSGWPHGKRFAVVLTHDVESAAGLEKCRELMQLEMSFGVRSSFNFIPEGDYKVPAELRAELVSHGFEVGIHDLRHDGQLFASRRKFSRNAMRINSYLRDWNATGFRAGFMLHKLDWLHELDIQYDASTFDTDPFEPQPQGCHTIFPFWVPRRIANHESRVTNHSADSRPGYVELPYTLPQDSTLFLLLREQTIDIWLRKLDWIAKHGGMALVNIHPDYLCFDGAVETDDQYSCSRYKAFLEYLHKQYEGAFWNETPAEVAQFYARAMKVPTATAAEA